MILWDWDLAFFLWSTGLHNTSTDKIRPWKSHQFPIYDSRLWFYQSLWSTCKQEGHNNKLKSTWLDLGDLAPWLNWVRAQFGIASRNERFFFTPNKQTGSNMNWCLSLDSCGGVRMLSGPVTSNCDFGWATCRREQARLRKESLLLCPWLNMKTRTLDGGWKTRLLIAAFLSFNRKNKRTVSH